MSKPYFHLNRYLTIARGDFRNVWRDPMLIWTPFLAVFVALILRVGLPIAQSIVLEEFAFDLTPYFPLIVSTYIVLTPQLTGSLVGFLLLDERDERTLTAMRVTPISMSRYLAFRLALPVLLSIILTMSCYPMIGHIPLPFLKLLLVSLLAASTAPVMALFMAAFAENKVAGFAVMKFANGLMMIPMAAYFFETDWSYLAGIISTFWPVKAFWLASAGESFGSVFWGGLGANLIVTALLFRRFKKQLS